MSSWRSLRALPIVAALGIASAVPAAGQQQSGQPPAQQNQAAAPDKAKPDAPAEAPQVTVPPEILEKILAGGPDALAAASAFLIGSGPRKPEAIAQRATALISQIGKNRGGMGTDSLLRVVDRIASQAISLVAGSQVVQIGIDKDFVPRRALLAWDFGPPDGQVAPGFERVKPGDSRIGGTELSALRRPGDDNLLQSGVSGVERIEADVPDGEYRIILMTQNLGDSKMMSSPFGSEIVVNGNAQSINQPSPENWAKNAVLSNRGLQDAAAAGPGSPGGFVAGDLSKYDQSMFKRQQGGAIVVTATARGGKLIIELKGFRGSRSYLTGLMVEPASTTSDLVLSQEAAQAFAPPELRLALEENILGSAARVLADIDPADGDPELVELPEPILDPEENASASS